MERCHHNCLLTWLLLSEADICHFAWIFCQPQAAGSQTPGVSLAVAVFHGLVPLRCAGGAGKGRGGRGMCAVPMFPLLPSPPLPPARPSDLTAPLDMVRGPPLPPPRPADLAQPRPIRRRPKIRRLRRNATNSSPPGRSSGTAPRDRRLFGMRHLTRRSLVEAVILKEGRRVALAPPALLNCAMAGALAVMAA